MQNISLSELHKQIKTHLECLKVSGIEWLENNNNSTSQAIAPNTVHAFPRKSLATDPHHPPYPINPTFAFVGKFPNGETLLKFLSNKEVKGGSSVYEILEFDDFRILASINDNGTQGQELVFPPDFDWAELRASLSNRLDVMYLVLSDPQLSKHPDADLSGNGPWAWMYQVILHVVHPSFTNVVQCVCYS